MKTLVLLDTHALIHRAYHALPKFKSKKTGEPTGALYGLSAMLIKAIRDLKPNYMAAAYDLPGPTFRHDSYEGYKAKRPEADEDLIAQLKRAHDITDAFGISGFSALGFEADDVLGTIVEIVKKSTEYKDLTVIIVSGDMDILQMVEDEKVLVYTMRKGIDDTLVYDEKKVEERYGFGPKAIPDYKGLRGDPSDNIVGVAGIGEKTATDIIKNFGTIENLYKEIEKAPPAGGADGKLKDRILKLLIDHKKDAFFSKTLATIRRDVPINFEFSLTEWRRSFDKKKPQLIALFEELGFDSLIKRLEDIATQSIF